MTLFPPDAHPHGMPGTRLNELLTADRSLIFAFHGCQRAVQKIVHGRPHGERFHVHGFVEQGTTTTPPQIVSLNGMSRYRLCIEALRRTDRLGSGGPALADECERPIDRAAVYAVDPLEDPPEITTWTWSDA